MIERPDADALMSGPLGQWLAEQQAGRDQARAWARRARLIALGVAAGVAVVTLILSGRIETALKVAFFVALAGFGIAEVSKLPMIKRIKSGINGAIAKALGLEYSADCTPGKTFERAKQFEMVPGYDGATFQDLWWGVVSGRPFTLHEARLTEQRGSGKNRRTVTVFAGSILSIGFTRRFASTTLIEADGARSKFLIGREKDQVTIGGIDLRRIDMVNSDFERRFTVWSTDQVEARYLVHPAYIERMLAVEKAFAGEKIRALFHEGELLVVLESGDLFESGSLDAGKDRALLERSISQFGSLADLAAQLNERERMTMSDIARPS